VSKNTLAKLNKVVNRQHENERAPGGRTSGIFFDFKDGDNQLRLIGEFVEMKTHFIAPAPARKNRGLCKPEAFNGEDRISVIINCPDWDINTEEAASEKTCPICRLNALAQGLLRENGNSLDEKAKTYLIKLMSDTGQRTQFKWNVIDRDDPTVTQVTGDGEQKVFGYKIAGFGMGAWRDITGIFSQVGFDITDPEKGIDIIVTKDNGVGKGGRVSYSAKAVIEGTSVKVTPLTDDEKSVGLNDIRKVSGKQVNPQAVYDALHNDLKGLLDDDGDSGDETPEVEEPTSKKAKAKPKPEKKEVEEECFGTFEEGHPECEGCPKKTECKDATE